MGARLVPVAGRSSTIVRGRPSFLRLVGIPFKRVVYPRRLQQPPHRADFVVGVSAAGRPAAETMTGSFTNPCNPAARLVLCRLSEH